MIHWISRLFRANHFHDIIECLVAALEAKDVYTAGHSSRVADMSLDLAKALGLKGMALEDVHIAAHLHDIGKVGVPEGVLNKSGKLLPQEWAQMKMHPQIGYDILNKSKELHKIAEIVLHHHERWDGKGYPYGLRREEIPLGARIIGVADTIDAMSSARSYRQAMPWNGCVKEVSANRGAQFDPAVVSAAAGLWEKWRLKYLGMEAAGTACLKTAE